MGFWQTLSGRTTPRRPALDALFGIPGAAITLETAMDFAPTGIGAVCYRKAEGPAFLDAEERLVALLDSDEGPDVERVDDTFGFTWLVVRTEPVDPGALVTDLHAVNSTLEAEGFARGLLCSVVGFRDRAGRTLGLVYRYGEGASTRSRPWARRRTASASRCSRCRCAPPSSTSSRWSPTSPTGCPSGAAPPSDPRRPGDQSRWLLPGRASIRSSATLA